MLKCSNAQWEEFNQAHPVSCQWPAYNYQPHGQFDNVFVVDVDFNYYDGYLLFGNGVICHPDSVVNHTRCYAAKCNINGDLVWWNRYDEPEVDQNSSWYSGYPANMGGMISDYTGQFVSIFSTFIAGDEFNSESRDYLVKLDINGEITTQNLVDSSLAKYAFYGLIEDPVDSTYVTYGWYQDSLDVINNTAPDAFLLKVDSLGQHLWQQEYSNTFKAVRLAKALDGGYWIIADKATGLACSDGWFSNTDMVLIKTDAFGNEEDRMIFGGDCWKDDGMIHEYEEDRVVLVGRLTNQENDQDANFAGYYYSTLINQNEDGTLSEISERKTYLPTYNGDFVDLHPSDDGYMLVSDNQLLPSQGSNTSFVGRWKGCLMKLDQNRDSLWMRSYAYFNNALDGDDPWQIGEHFLLDSKPTPDGGWVCSGYIKQLYSDPNPNLLTPWVFKVDSMGCLEPGCQFVGVSEMVLGLEDVMSLYPNPVNSVAHINFSFPINYSPPTLSELLVIDLQGKEVLRQAIQHNSASSLTVDLNLQYLSSGIYTVHWISEGAWLDSVKLVKE
jgi:hypothetical protein